MLDALPIRCPPEHVILTDIENRETGRDFEITEQVPILVENSPLVSSLVTQVKRADPEVACRINEEVGKRRKRSGERSLPYQALHLLAGGTVPCTCASRSGVISDHRAREGRVRPVRAHNPRELALGRVHPDLECVA